MLGKAKKSLLTPFAGQNVICVSDDDSAKGKNEKLPGIIKWQLERKEIATQNAVANLTRPEIQLIARRRSGKYSSYLVQMRIF